MNEFPRILRKRLENLHERSCRRVLSVRSGLDFSSSDYLGFSQDPSLKKKAWELLEGVPLGASASRLLRGQLEVFERVEQALADFCGRESATLFPSGYQANLGLLSSLLTPEDIVFSDQYNHASIIDGIRLSGAKKKIYPHLDLKALRRLLEVHASEGDLKVIVTESVFSMEGTLAPLPELVDLAREFSALLIVDEAHATGLWGDFENHLAGGRVQNLKLEEKVFATIHTGGKALGLGGAWICGSEDLKNYLLNFSRPFIFSTAISPVLAVLLEAAVLYWREVGRERAEGVLNRSQYLQKKLTQAARHSVEVQEVQGPIVPVMVGGNDRALWLAQKLRGMGFDIRAIRPPTVPEGKARLRLTTNWGLSADQIDSLSLAFSKILVDEGPELASTTLSHSKH